MKKLFLVFAIGAFFACNDDSNSTSTTTDSTATDTSLVTPPVDTTNRSMDTTHTTRPDSTVRK